MHMTKKFVSDVYQAEVNALVDDHNSMQEFKDSRSPYTYNINKQTLIDDLHAELSALSSRVERARKGEFKLYTGFSWPVIYGDTAADHNHGVFQLTGEMPAVPRTRTEFYLSKMAKTANLFNDMAAHSDEFHEFVARRTAGLLDRHDT